MSVRVIGISGSPHRHGNTETLLDAFLDGAGRAGGSIEKVILKDLAYTPCRGCNACHKDGECIVKDEALPLFDRILLADSSSPMTWTGGRGYRATPPRYQRHMPKDRKWWE